MSVRSKGLDGVGQLACARLSTDDPTGGRMGSRAAILTLASVLTLTACSSDEVPDTAPNEPAASGTDAGDEPEAASPDEGAADDGTDAAATDEVADNEPTAEPLATADTEWGGIGGGAVRLDILDLQRRGEDLLEVRFAITNTEDDGRLSPYQRLSHDGSENDVSGLTVEDVDAGERLLTLRDSADVCVCSTDTDLSIPAGSTRQFYARFPAPVSDRVDVAIPTFGTFNDLPVQ